MRDFLRRVPAFLSALVLGAHFLRAGNLPLVGFSLAAIALFFVRRTWAWAASIALLLAGGALWGWTAWRIAQIRMQSGQPFARLVVILSAVGLVSLVSAAVLPRPRRDQDLRRNDR
jgi:hypothetical protein